MERTKINFDDTSSAFSSLKNNELKKRRFVFHLLRRKWIAKIGTFFLKTAIRIHLPVSFLVKKTIFPVFVGGESVKECHKNIQKLQNEGVYTILDYSVEAQSGGKNYDKNKKEFIRAITWSGHNNVPFLAIKLTALGNRKMLRKLTAKKFLKRSDRYAYAKLWRRINALCERAREYKVHLFIDAEETWIQGGIDHFTLRMMRIYNREKVVIFHTVQMYRKAGQQLLEEAYHDAKKHDYHLGVKLVRGAYMEKERNRAMLRQYESPIQPDKATVDATYDKALHYCVKNQIAVCAGTHNEASSKFLTDLMDEFAIQNDDKICWFAQLYGMSDHITYTLAHHGYNAAKYMPYGPVKEVIPYLIRRSEENTSVAGQTGRELELIERELQNRKK